MNRVGFFLHLRIQSKSNAQKRKTKADCVAQVEIPLSIPFLSFEVLLGKRADSGGFSAGLDLMADDGLVVSRHNVLVPENADDFPPVFSSHHGELRDTETAHGVECLEDAVTGRHGFQVCGGDVL